VADLDEVPERVVRAAGEIFRTCGFEGTEMRAIAERAGTSVGTIYHYFPGKWGLFTRILLEGWESLRRQVRQVAADPTLDWRARVAGILEAEMRYVAANGPLWLDLESMAGGAQRLPPGGDPALLRQFTDWLTAEVGDALDAGRRPDRERLALALVSAAAALARRWPADAAANAALLRSLLVA
jgi:AcrR family transcriptional regulator